MTTKIRLLHDTVGIPTGAVAVTQSASDNTTKVATTAYVTTALAALADSAPSTLNTLNELAAALGDDANFSTTVTNAIAAKLPLAGGTLTGNLTVPYLATTSYIDLNNSGNRGKIGWSGNHTYVATTSSVGSIIFKNNVGSTASPQTGGDTLLTIADGPKVGIGTTDPSGILSIPATDTTTKPQIRFMTTGATNLADAALSTTDDSGGTSLLIGSNQYYSGGSIARFDTSRSGTAIDFGYTGRIKFFTGAGNAAPTERMQIDSGGKILIGTTSNNYARAKFTVFGTPGNPETTGTATDNVAIRVATDSGNSQALDIGMYNSGDYGAWFQASNSGSLNSHSPIALNPNGGKVGIGTATPNSPLHVKTTNQSIQVRNTGNDNVGLEIYRDSDGAKGASFGWGNGNANLEIKNYRNDGQAAGPYANIDFFTGGTTADSPDYAPTRRMRIQQTGEVGFGIDNPEALIHGHASSPQLRLTSSADSGTPVAQIGYAGGSGYFLRLGDAANNEDIMFRTYGNSFFNGGNLGIGTSSPQALLDLTVGNAKTANAGVWGYLGKTNEASGYQALQCFQIGGNAADERRYEFQTIEQGVSNNGIIVLQKSGGRVFVGHDSADGNADKLVVSGSIGISNDAFIGAGSGFGPSNGAGSSGTIQLYSSSTGNMTFAANFANADTVFNMSGNTKFEIKRSAAGTEAIRLHTLNGGIRIGALNGSYHHTMRVSGPSTYYWDNRCEASGGFHTHSDERLKKEITPVTGALDSVAKMNGVTFKWKDAAKRGGGDAGKQFGVLAQNMLTVDSELPSLKPDPLETQENIDDDSKDTDYYSMDYSRITPFLIEAIKELKTKLEAAEARITTLEG